MWHGRSWDKWSRGRLRLNYPLVKLHRHLDGAQYATAKQEKSKVIPVSAIDAKINGLIIESSIRAPSTSRLPSWSKSFILIHCPSTQRWAVNLYAWGVLLLRHRTMKRYVDINIHNLIYVDRTNSNSLRVPFPFHWRYNTGSFSDWLRTSLDILLNSGRRRRRDIPCCLSSYSTNIGFQKEGTRMWSETEDESSGQRAHRAVKWHLMTRSRDWHIFKAWNVL